MAAAAVTNPHSVAVHVGHSTVWAASGEQVFECAADLRSDSSVSGVVEMSPLVFVDDDYVDVDDRIRPTVLALADLFERVVRGCGVPGPDRVYLTHPSHWGHRRRNQFLDAARRVASDVMLVPMAVAVARSRRSQWRDRCVVVEQRPTEVAVSVVEECGDELRITFSRVAANRELMSLVASVGAISRRDAMMVVGMQSRRTAALLDADVPGSSVRGGIRAVDESELVTAVIDPRLRPIPAAGVDDRVLREEWQARVADVAVRPEPADIGPATTRSRRRRAVLAGVLTLVAVAVVGLTIRTAGIEKSNSALDKPISTIRQTGIPESGPPVEEPGAAPTSLAAGQVRVGEVEAVFPSGWRFIPKSAEPGRTDAVPPTGTDRKIVIVETALRPGSTVDEVHDSLHQQFSAFEDPLRFGEFAVVGGADGRRTATYVEFPDNYSEVRWRVYVEGGFQISVGCQYLLDEWDAVAADCRRVWETVHVVE
ncbi:type VII secretion-associated protein (TIGR03931 family) [Rhodococcus sp. 27YEA15]|uniref:type VII secretion-associated protein n=1 Tax=Rhodococcus sp. 27YEA15 TaxID=3156259 RepID=UPI003C7E4A5D